MSASTTAARLACLDCGSAPADRSVAGESLSECPSCGSLRVPRPALERLRDMPPAAHALWTDPAGALAGAPSPKLVAIRRCLACRTPLLSHPFGGGNVRVESCAACDSDFG